MADRRAVLWGIGVAGLALGAGIPVLAAPSFDAAGYVADLRAVGYEVYLTPSIRGGGSTFLIMSADGFGDELLDIERKHDRKADPEAHAHIVAFLYAERGGRAYGQV